MPKRRWRSSAEAYRSGQAVGFMAAIELLRILANPEEFKTQIETMGDDFAAAIRAAKETKNDA